MKKLSYSQLIEALKKHKGATVIGLTTLTDAKALKTNNPFGVIFKHCRCVGFCGADYENAVKNEGFRQEKEIDFVSAPLSWGEWLIGGKVITHKGEFYLRLQSSPGQRKRQPVKILSYRDEKGKFLDFDDIKPFLPVEKESKKQSEAGLEGKEKQIMVRTYRFSSIRVIRVFGQSFELVPDSITGEQIAAIETRIEKTKKNLKKTVDN